MKHFKRIFIYILLNSFHSHCSVDYNKSAVTYDFNGGRFGDNLHSFAQAKWVAYKFNIPFLYKPFRYSDQLYMHNNELRFNQQDLNKFKKIEILKDISTDKIEKDAGILYVCNWETKLGINFFDTQYRSELQKQISPLINIPKIEINPLRVGIAVHARLGYGPFELQLSTTQPLLVPPCKYYSERLKEIYSILQKPLHVHIFSDSAHIEKFVEFLKEEIKERNIEYSYRKFENRPDANVIEDFFGMMQFDYLIRTGSHYSTWAARLGDFKITMIPAHASLVDGKWVIDKVLTIKKNR